MTTYQLPSAGISSERWIAQYKNSKLPHSVCEAINRQCTTGECSRYGMVDAVEADYLASACLLANAANDEQAYAVYRYAGMRCVVTRDGHDVTGPVKSHTRPHYGDPRYSTRRLTPQELADVAIEHNLHCSV